MGYPYNGREGEAKVPAQSNSDNNKTWQEIRLGKELFKTTKMVNDVITIA